MKVAAIKKGVITAIGFVLCVYLVAQISTAARSQAAILADNELMQSRGSARPCSESSGRQNGVTDPSRADFNHGCNEHLKECNMCHTISRETPKTRAEEQRYLEVNKYPSHKACIECHSHQNFAVESLKRPTAFCGACHLGSLRDINPAVFTVVGKKKFSEDGRQKTGPSDFGTNFSHTAHQKPVQLPNGLSVRYIRESGFPPLGVRAGEPSQCVYCHRLVNVSVGQPDRAVETGHKSCFQCHGEQPAGARQRPASEFPFMNDCAACHEIGGKGAPHNYGQLAKLNFRHQDHRYEIRPIYVANNSMPANERQFIVNREADRQVPGYLCIECHQMKENVTTLAAIKAPNVNTCTECHYPNRQIGRPDPIEKVELADPLKSEVLNALQNYRR